MIFVILIESKNCIKHVYDDFCAVIVYCVEHRKIPNLLFDTFHNTKYFHAHIYVIACHFCVGYFTYPNAMKILW